MRRSSRQRRRRGFLWPIIGLLFLVFVFSRFSKKEQPALAAPSLPASVQLQSQIFNDDLVVKRGQVYEQDVSVYDGDVTVQKGGVIQGNLYVYSGDVTIDEGGEVKGDIAAFSGDVEVAGAIGGRIAAWSGDVDLADSATIGGDVSVLSGDIKQAPGAQIRGNVVRGPNFKIPVPSFFQAPAAPAAPVPNAAEAVRAPRTTLWGSLLGVILRLLAATVLTVIVAGLAWLLYTVQPDFVRKVRRTAEEQPALSFAVGAIVNLGLLFVTFVLFVTVCLIPLGLVTGFLLIALNIVGWSAISLVVGERVSRYGKSTAQPITYLVLGVLVTAGAVGVLWAFGCWRTCIFLIILLISAPGVGALLIPWLKLGRQYATGRGSAGPVTPTTVAPVTPTASTETVSPAPITPAATAEQASEQTSSVVEPAAPIDEKLSEITGVYDAPTPEELPSTPPISSDLEAGTAIVETPAPPEPVADFTQIKGIGPTFAARLQVAGIHTFAQLAAMTPEAIATIIGWTPDLVISDDVIGQARVLAQPV